MGLIPLDRLKIIRIKNTSCLNEIDVSEAYKTEIEQHAELEVIKEKHALVFDDEGNLLPF